MLRSHDPWFPQVAGLPTNLPFLRRLSAHPDFAAAASLDTTFIPAHAAELMAPQLLPPQLVALAGVARVMLKVGGRVEVDQQSSGAAALHVLGGTHVSIE